MRHTARFAIALSLFAGFATGCNTTPPIAVVSPFEEEVVVTPSVPIEVAFQPGTTPASFQAVLDGTDVTSSFTVTASGASASLPIGSLGAGTGRNRLVVSIASGSGTAKDVAEFSVSQAQAVATVVTPSSAGLLVGGPQARGRVGDYALYNDLIRVVIDDITPVDDSGKSIRSAYGAHVYGGNIIDGDLQRAPGDPDRDSFEVVTPLINVESTPHYTSATIVNDGTDGGPAVIRFEGVDDIFDTQNLSSLIVFLGGGAFALPAQFDDHDLPIEISTEYSLAPGENFVRITTAIKNLGPSDLAIPIGDWVNGGGEGEIFFPGLGYGGTSGAGTMFRLDADYLAWVANGPTMAGVSYGYVPDAQGGNDAVSNGGLNIILNDASILDLLFGATPHFVVPAGGTNSYSRKFVIGNGDTTPISTVRDRTLGVTFGTVEGFVRSGGQPVAGARVSVVSLGGDLFQSLKVIAALETDADGHYIGTVPVGVYNLVVNAEGYPAPSAVGLNVPVDGAGVANMDLALDAAGFVTVDVVDEGAAPSPAKVSLVGIDPSPSSTVSLNLLGFITATGGVFRNDGDFLPRGVSAVKFAGLDGHVASFPVEPGQYQVVVSRGPEYDVDRQTVTVGAGATVAVNATVRKVLDTAGFVSSDFHQHQQASYDAPASDPTRVLTNIAEGLDFFVSTDHDFISDLSPAIAAAGASSTIGYAKGAEITPSDYGHINPWPLVQDPTTRNMGAFDWSGGEVPGTDFPSLGRFSKAPAEIYAGLRALPPAGHPRVVQINHLNALQMGTFEALGIDTGLVPPQSNFSPADFRLDPSSANLFDPGFDAMELWIGSNNDELSQLTEQNLGDWFNLMNQGLVKTATLRLRLARGEDGAGRRAAHLGGVVHRRARVGGSRRDRPEHPRREGRLLERALRDHEHHRGVDRRDREPGTRRAADRERHRRPGHPAGERAGSALGRLRQHRGLREHHAERRRRRRQCRDAARVPGHAHRHPPRGHRLRDQPGGGERLEPQRSERLRAARHRRHRQVGGRGGEGNERQLAHPLPDDPERRRCQPEPRGPVRERPGRGGRARLRVHQPAVRRRERQPPVRGTARRGALTWSEAAALVARASGCRRWPPSRARSPSPSRAPPLGPARRPARRAPSISRSRRRSR